MNDPSAWHNVFYAHITCKIDEDVFSVLFDREQGRPNACVRRLVSMMILKEGFGWSDAQLFEQCGFNILVMRALGLMNLSDEVPVASTYYLFKQSLYAYGLQRGRNLIGETFSSLTKTQAKVFGVTGQQVRMDSKLIGANIATCCRLQADNAFVQPAIERTQEVVGQVSDVSMDGAYHAACNSAYADKEDKQFYYSGLQGRPGRLIYERTEEGVEVIDRHSGEIQLAQEYKPGKYKLFIAGKPRYITQQDILAYHRRKQIEDMPVHIRNRRHNVEASIFQLSYHTTGGKTRYRRLLPHQVWAWCRSLWINLVRIKNYLAQPNEDPPIGAPC